MRLAVEFEPTEQYYLLLITIYQNGTCILRTNYKHFYMDRTDQECMAELYHKLSDACLRGAPMELFSDDSIHRGSSLALTFINGAFMYAHTIMPSSSQEATTSNVYLLHPEEMMQFYCEMQRLMAVVQAHKKLRP